MCAKSSIRLLSICFLILAAGLPGAFARDVKAPADRPTAPVLIDGREILRVRGILGTTAEWRAQVVADRIVRFASDPYFNTASITIVESDISSDIVSSDSTLMSVFDIDAQAEGQSRQELAAGYAPVIREAIERYKREHSSRNILKGLLFALLLTLGLIAVLYVIHRLSRTIQSRLPDWIQEKIVPAAVKKYELVRPENISGGILGLVKIVRFAAILTLLYFYMGLVFSFFPWTQGLAGKLLLFIVDPLKSVGLAVQTRLPSFFFLAILVLITRYVLKVAKMFFKGIETGTIEITGFDPDWAQPTYKILRILALAFALTIAYPHIPGSDSDAFKGVSIFLGILLSLGSTSLVSNIVAGLTITYMRAFKVGDRISIQDYTGDVIAQRLQVTHIQTPKNEIISVPNSSIINSHVINYSALARERRLILHSTVGIGYEVPWRQVRAMLLMAAERTRGLLKNPAPFVRLKSLTDFCVTYEINACTEDAQQMERIYSDLHKHILDAFNEYEVQIMTPNYEGDRPVPAIVPKDQWYAAPADRFPDSDAGSGDEGAS